jgi:hypothetical protein
MELTPPRSGVSASGVVEATEVGAAGVPVPGPVSPEAVEASVLVASGVVAGTLEVARSVVVSEMSLVGETTLVGFAVTCEVASVAVAAVVAGTRAVVTSDTMLLTPETTPDTVARRELTRLASVVGVAVVKSVLAVLVAAVGLVDGVTIP